MFPNEQIPIILKFRISKKATKIDKIPIID